MLYVLLPGYSTKNLPEIEEIAASLENAGYKVYAHKWRHWKNPEIDWSEEGELANILEYTKESRETEFGIIGKSIGSEVSLKLLKALGNSVKLIILLGIPCGNFSESKIQEFRSTLQKLAIPKYVIQNSNDPIGPVEIVKKIAQGTSVELVVKEAADHRYSYPQEVLNILKRHF